MKKILSSLLVAAMVLSLITVPAFAAAADMKVDMVITEGTHAGKNGLFVELQAQTGADKLVGVSYSFAYDPSVFELLDKDGAVINLDGAATDVNYADKMVAQPTGFDADLSYVHVVKMDKMVGVVFCNGSFAGITLEAGSKLNKAFLAYKTGKTIDDVNKSALRQATADEAVTTLGEPAVTYVSNTSFEEFKFGTTDNTDTANWGSSGNVTFGKDFTFHEPAALTDVVITGPASALIPTAGAADTVVEYSAKGVDQYGKDFNSTAKIEAKGTLPAGVTFDGSKLTVKSTAKAGTITLTATATAGGVTKTKDLTVTLSAMTVNWPTAAVVITYGDKASAVAAKVTGVTGSAAGATVQGTVTAKDPDAVVAIDAKTVPVIFTATTGAVVEGEVKVTVNKKALTIAAADAKVTYTYAVAADALTWTVKDADLVNAADKADIKANLTSAYKAGDKVGEYAITGTATSDKYVVTVTAGKLTVEPKDIALVGLAAADVTYTGAAAKPVVTAKDGDTALVADTDFTVASADVNVGPATATVTGKGNYTGTATVAFQITKLDLTGKTPVITGSAKAGQTVTAEIEGLTNADAEVTFAWYYTVNGDTALVEGATGSSLKLTSDLVGAKLTVKATGKGVHCVGTTETSEAVTVSRASSGRPSGGGRGDSDTTTTSKLPFVDVAETDWFYKDVEAAYKSKLMNGVDETHFAPNATTSRAMIATILWRVAGEPEARVKIADFPDVDGNSWYIKAVRWAAEQEIVKGFETGEFGPNVDITREQMAAMIYRYNTWKKGETKVEGDLADFADAESVSDWAKEAVVWATKEGIITGKPGSLLDPQGTATRAEAVTMLQRYVK